jgi:PIN domain nuclease of toxin-antitoxin system
MSKPKASTTPRTILLDTHAAVWLAAGTPNFTQTTLRLLESSFHTGRLAISPISAWEIGLLASRNKLNLGQAPINWFYGFTSQFNVSILELTPEVAISSSYLPHEFHGDPADRIIIATAQFYSASLLTADKDIIEYARLSTLKVIPCRQ